VSIEPDIQATVADLVRRGFHSVVFQPIRRVSDGSIFAFEALMRGPAGTPLATPAEIFRSNAIDRTLLHELDAACALSAVRLGRVLEHALFVNIHGETLLRAADSPDSVLRMLALVEIDPSRLVLEISETTEVAHLSAIERTLAPLRARGVRLALDDVGSQGAWVGQMLALCPEFLKIDRELIADIDRTPQKANVVGGLVAFARTTHTSLIVEGIERAEELEVIRAAGIDLAQGFALGMPQPAQEWVRFSSELPDRTRVAGLFE
jgi:EAL domain-containing protein (putative c-di-GMP-specific phosphodiesterase class I)